MFKIYYDFWFYGDYQLIVSILILYSNFYIYIYFCIFFILISMVFKETHIVMKRQTTTSYPDWGQIIICIANLTQNAHKLPIWSS